MSNQSRSWVLIGFIGLIVIGLALMFKNSAAGMTLILLGVLWLSENTGQGVILAEKKPRLFIGMLLFLTVVALVLVALTLAGKIGI